MISWWIEGQWIWFGLVFKPKWSRLAWSNNTFCTVIFPNIISTNVVIMLVYSSPNLLAHEPTRVASSAHIQRYRLSYSVFIGKQWLNPLCFCRISSAIIKSHPLRSDVFKSDLDKNLPNIQDIQAALLKLRQICVIGNQYPVGERDDCSTHSIE